MDPNPAKRRKLQHQEPHDSSNSSAALEAASTSGASRSSTFVLQTRELLREVRINYDNHFAGADELLHRVKSTIEAISPQDPTPIHQASKSLEKKHKILVPFPDPKPSKDSPYKVSFAKPSQCNVVGSYVSKTMIKSQGRHAIDMIVEIPKDIFQDKDYLDLRYFYKRAYYLAVLTASLRDELGSSVGLAYEYANGNRLLPVLVLTSKDSPKEYQIRVIPCAPEGLFPARKLLPASCCIRSASDAESKTPTPFYNSTLKAESSYVPYLKLLRQAEKSCPAFKEACILGRVWLFQRGLDGSVPKGGFGHFEWATLTALLLQGGGRKGVSVLSPSLSGTQIFKAVVQYLASVDLSKKPLVFGPSKQGSEAWKESGPVIYDAVRQLNVGYKMSSWSASMLQQHAKWTYTSLADREADQFNPTFITKADLPLQSYDALIQVERALSSSEGAITDHRGASWEYRDRVARILKKALGDRIQLINVHDVSDADQQAWDLKSAPATEPTAILVGVLFTANVSRQVDHGPAVEEKDEAKKFRQFWGEKSELRRFKDGSILESLIWSQTSPLGLCEEIARYILKLHLKIHDEDLTIHGRGFSAVVPIKSADLASFQAARQAFQTFEGDLRNLGDSLPLQIRQVAAAAPELRFASVRPPQLTTSKAAAQPMDTVIFFEASGKWPENLAAIQRTKIAFLLRIGELLAESKPGVTCQVGLEETQTEIENLAFLDATYEDGAVFRLRIHSDLEESLLERRTKDKTLDQRIRTQGAQLLASFKRTYTHLPLHTQTISTFCTRFPALSPTVRLLKRWFDAHKLSCHFLEEMVELIALRVFLEPYPWQAPSSGMTGFLRTLQFLARWDWRTEPLILDSSGELTGAERSAIGTRLEAWRKLDPGMSHTTLVVATSNETSGTAYTIHDGRPWPSKVVATRMTTLARSACKIVKEKGIDLEPKILFQPSLKDYDILIHLNGKVMKNIPRADEGAKQSQFKNLDGRTGTAPLPLVQQPARSLLKQFDSLFSGPLLLFHGGPEDPVIAGIWNPQIQRRNFRVNLPCSFKPVGTGKGDGDADDEEKQLVEVNREAIVAEIARIGGDCIDSIESKRS
ncbi:U3 snoRNP protein [Cytospora paraplurivora]|uniref:U3 small nucleolar RNA-associated protein 22 n=1 Tax=Cytospora paraplurivora TaxID=2898453 RepID=A0AAN9UFR6_9PEZI